MKIAAALQPSTNLTLDNEIIDPQVALVVKITNEIERLKRILA